jgi:hypothetical protein
MEGAAGPRIQHGGGGAGGWSQRVAGRAEKRARHCHHHRPFCPSPSQLLAAHAPTPALADLGYLLNDHLHLALPRPAAPSASAAEQQQQQPAPDPDLTPAQADRALRGLLVSLLRGLTADGLPACIVLDDCHWMHPASWELAQEVAAAAALPPDAPAALPLVLVLVTRPPRHHLDVVCPTVPRGYLALKVWRACV